jgi:hypothetical protein
LTHPPIAPGRVSGGADGSPTGLRAAMTIGQHLIEHLRDKLIVEWLVAQLPGQRLGDPDHEQ